MIARVNVKASPVGVYIRLWRLEHEIGLRDLASIVGVSHVFLYKVERGTRPPRAKLMRALKRKGLVECERMALASRLLDAAETA